MGEKVGGEGDRVVCLYISNYYFHAVLEIVHMHETFIVLG